MFSCEFIVGILKNNGRFRTLIVSAIEQLKNKKRSDEHAIIDFLQKKGSSINQQILSRSKNVKWNSTKNLVKMEPY